MSLVPFTLFFSSEVVVDISLHTFSCGRVKFSILGFFIISLKVLPKGQLEPWTEALKRHNVGRSRKPDVLPCKSLYFLCSGPSY